MKSGSVIKHLGILDSCGSASQLGKVEQKPDDPPRGVVLLVLGAVRSRGGRHFRGVSLEVDPERTGNG